MSSKNFLTIFTLYILMILQSTYSPLLYYSNALHGFGLNSDLVLFLQSLPKMCLVSLNQSFLNILSKVALLSQIPRKLRQFCSKFLLPMFKNCKCSLISATIMVEVCAILQIQLHLFMLSFAKTLLCIGIILSVCYVLYQSAMCSLCTVLCIHPILALPDFAKLRFQIPNWN